MKYLLMAYEGEQWLARMSNSARYKFEQAVLSNNEALRARGQLLVAESLYSKDNITTVQVYNDKVSVIDGALTTAQEPLIGIYLITARDLNDAIQVVAQMPQARAGPIEVRPLLER